MVISYSWAYTVVTSQQMKLVTSNNTLTPHRSRGRFDVLQGSQCFTCTVGMKISKAQYYVEDTDAVVNMMQVCDGW